ncbi:MAG TPA: helix-turn-helix domain-containing protein [Solirubrobacteraceae bacterium]
MPASKHTARPATARDELDPRIVRALSHPVRHRVLVALNERVASPKELAAELGEPLGNVSYHTRVLVKLGCIELVSTTQRRGALEHHYRAVMRPYFDDAAWAKMPLSTRRALFDHELDRLWSHTVDAAGVGGFDHPRAHVSWTLLDLDDQGLNDLADVLGSTLDRALEIQAESAGRRAERGDNGGADLRTELAILHFERAPKPAAGTTAGGRRKRSAGRS